MSDKLLTTEEVAKLFNVEKVTIWRWKRMGCPCHKLNLQKFGYKEQEVREWINSHGEDDMEAQSDT